MSLLGWRITISYDPVSVLLLFCTKKHDIELKQKILAFKTLALNIHHGEIRINR